MKTIDPTAFESIYAGQPRWETGRPQRAILDVADRVTGSVLDAGCGTGENALFFAGRGQKVTGIDFLPEPISLAKRKAAGRGPSGPGEASPAGAGGESGPGRWWRATSGERLIGAPNAKGASGPLSRYCGRGLG